MRRMIRSLTILLLSGGSLLTASAALSATTGDWSYCAAENGNCIFTGTQTVRYGAGTTFVTQTLAWGASCNNAAFGDPAPGVTKHCEVSNTWHSCASENGTCSFSDTETVRYGAGTTYNANVVTGGESCNNNVFGDPDPGIAKHCDAAPTTWTQCSAENGQCSFSGTQIVLYGANGSYTTKSLTNGAACNNGTFGDPSPGNAKHCYVPGLPVQTQSNTGVTFPAAGTTFNLVNGTNGTYADNNVYWTMVGQDPNNHGAYSHVNCAGQLVPMTASDNNAQTKNGSSYANYSIPLSQCKSFTVPQITSGRMYLSVGSPMYLKSVGSPVTGYTGPNIDNPSDPNIDVIFDFVEMDINSTNFFGNTTRVDQFGFPVRLQLQGQGGFNQTVGETESRASLFQEFVAQVPGPFQTLAQAPYAPYRIVAPAHGSFNTGGANATYLDSYIQSIWNKYTTSTLTFTDAQGTFTGHVVGGQFQFTDGLGTYYINAMPTTAMVLLGDGVLNDASNAASGLPTAKQLQIQAQLCAALNRHVADTPSNWTNSGSFYQTAPTNAYSAFWHAHSINGFSYGFPYDDVSGFSSSLIGTNPTVATITIGW
ncbi:glycoside hydrolase family 64 protein [Andreprevotia chitinilytica]|uniref:glycoside hydrolase family 64 protein n=1 Tax=Andreprevotia chitinilytica TaxID=396808 RepID=UPI001B802769|nr:glycoside hydrolase family 64 protein [Andreprevotia chitinilytica]